MAVTAVTSFIVEVGIRVVVPPCSQSVRPAASVTRPEKAGVMPPACAARFASLATIRLVRSLDALEAASRWAAGTRAGSGTSPEELSLAPDDPAVAAGAGGVGTESATAAGTATTQDSARARAGPRMRRVGSTGRL